jgi:hypothetical protein
VKVSISINKVNTLKQFKVFRKFKTSTANKTLLFRKRFEPLKPLERNSGGEKKMERDTKAQPSIFGPQRFVN